MKCASAAIAFVGVLLAIPAAAAEEEEEKSWVPKPPDPVRTSARLAADASYRRVIDVPMLMLGAAGSLGSERRSGGWHAQAHVLRGRTDEGLTVTSIDAGATGECRADRLRLGMSFRITYLDIARATAAPHIDTVGPGLAWSLGYDVTRADDGSGLLATAIFSMDGLRDAVLWGPSLEIGWRF